MNKKVSVCYKVAWLPDYTHESRRQHPLRTTPRFDRLAYRKRYRRHRRPVGTTGESATLSVEEHLSVIEETVKHVNKRVPVIAGTGANNTLEAIALSRAAEKAGADYTLSVVPYYNKPSQEGIYQHFKTIAEATSIPMIIYNVPRPHRRQHDQRHHPAPRQNPEHRRRQRSQRQYRQQSRINQTRARRFHHPFRR